LKTMEQVTLIRAGFVLTSRKSFQKELLGQPGNTNNEIEIAYE